MDDFVRCAALLASPATQPALRAQADAWLGAFRREPAAWGVALAVVRSPAAAAPPEVRLQAASLLAWKAKKQLAQLEEGRQAELAEALTELAEGPAAPGARQQLQALANLAIQCGGWARPLEMLGPRLGQERMLELLTLLPQECEDAVAALQSAAAEAAWALKARVHEWSPDVASWLHSLHAGAAAGGGGACGGSPGGPPSPPQYLAAGAAAAAARQEWEQLTLAVLRCFTAWTKLGCLQYVEHAHAAYFAGLAGELLFAPHAPRGLPFHPDCLPAAVDAATEVVEHATEALQPLLLQLAAALPARAAALHACGAEGGREAAEELCHVFALFCSTHCALCAARGAQGQSLRQGLLQLLALPLQPDSDAGGAALPAMGALADLLEHVLAQHRGERASEEEGEAEAEGTPGGGAATRPMEPEARRAFAAAALDVLLQQLQPFEGAFQAPPPGAACGAHVQPGTHSPQGVPDALRREAAPVVDYIGELLGADALLQRLVAHAEAAAARHGACSDCAQAALDVCLFVLASMSGLLESCCSERAAGDPLPQWLSGLLRLYSLVPDVDGCRSQAGPSPPPLTILHADLLASFTQLGPFVMPLLQTSQQQQQQQGLLQLVVQEALRALCGGPRTPDVAAGSTDDGVEHAAAALRVLCGSTAAAGLPTSPDLLAGVQRALGLLQQAERCEQYQDALGQVVVALVHALHGVPPGDPALRAQAEAVVQQHVFQPVAEALQGVEALMAAGAAAAQQQAAVRAAVWRLHAALRQLQALLNGLESYAWYEDGGSGSERSASLAAGAAAAEVVARGTAAAAVGAFLACWPRLADVCGWVGRLAPAGASLAAVRRELFQELSHCLSSCLSLDREAAQAALPSITDAAAACFFLPGASALARPLVQAVEIYGSLPHLQQPLLSTAAAVLAAPQARQLAGARGGDADPEAAEALLSLLACCCRQACQWHVVAQPAAMEAVLQLGLPLAVACAACNNRGTSLQATATLAATLALVLAADSPLHAPLLGWAAQQGPALVEGLLLALLSLSSGSHLPRVVSLMSDMALLAATLALAQQQQQQGGGGTAPSADDIAAAACVLLGSWVAAARGAVVRQGLLSEEAMASLLARWDWQPVLQQAAQQLTQQRQQGAVLSTSASFGEVRRALQRSVRQLVTHLRHSNHAGAAVAVA